MPCVAWAASRRGGCWRERRGKAEVRRGAKAAVPVASTQYSVLSTQYSVPSTQSPISSPASQISNLKSQILHISALRSFSFHSLLPLLLFSSPSFPPPSSCCVPLGEEAQVGAFFGAGSLALAVAADAGLPATPPRRDRAGGGPRSRQPAPPGPSQRGPQPRPQRPGHRADGLGLLPDRGRERVSRRSRPAGQRSQQRQRRLRPHRPERRCRSTSTSTRPRAARRSGFDPDQEDLLAKCRFYSFRVKSGDEASCLNLYQPRQPRLLGVGRNSSTAAASPGPTRPTCPIPGNCLLPTSPRTRGRDDAAFPSCSIRRPPTTPSIFGTAAASTSPSATPTIARWNFKSPGC